MIGNTVFLLWPNPFIVNKLEAGGGESNNTRLLILRNLLQTYERKNRTTRCMPASYVQNHVQRNPALRRCSSTQVLRRLRKTSKSAFQISLLR